MLEINPLLMQQNQQEFRINNFESDYFAYLSIAIRYKNYVSLTFYR